MLTAVSGHSAAGPDRPVVAGPYQWP